VRATSVALRALGVPALFAVARWNREPDSDHDVVRYARLQTSADEARFLKRAHRALADGRIVGVNLDVVRAGGEDGFFLGRRIRVGRGAAALARLTGARLVPVTRRFLGMSGRIEVTFHEPIADGDLDRASGMAFDGALLTRATAWFEAQARNHPGSLRRDRLESLLAAPPVDASDPDTASRAAQRRARLDEERHARHRAEWEAKWASSGFERPWLGRGISREIEEAVASGWFPPGARALDAGCGEGDVAAWLASRGYAAVGVDVAEAALERARNAHGERPPSLRFARVDLSRSVPEGGPFQVVVDRGCFHQIAEADRRAYAGHLASACAADARLLMFSRAFRDGVACGDPEEIRRKRAEVMEAFAPHFELQREAPTYLDRCHGARPDERLPGIVFWLRRRGSAEDS
jgi:SAM-dependent methyltransferase